MRHGKIVKRALKLTYFKGTISQKTLKVVNVAKKVLRCEELDILTPQIPSFKMHNDAHDCIYIPKNISMHQINSSYIRRFN